MQFQIQLAQGTGRIQARDGVLNPKSFDIGTESFSKVGDRLLLSLTLSVCWYVGYMSCEPPCSKSGIISTVRRFMERL